MGIKIPKRHKYPHEYSKKLFIFVFTSIRDIQFHTNLLII